MDSSATELGRHAQGTERVPAVLLQETRFAYGRGPTVLHIPHLQVMRGERVFIYGPSGSGKTTLLGLMAGVLRATSGVVRVLGTDLAELSNRRRDALRAGHVGYIFQMFNLIPYLSVAENIMLPVRVSSERRARLQGVAPELVIADEPTSALDSDRRETFLKLLFERCAAAGATLVFVSHDRQLQHMFDRALSLADINTAAVDAGMAG